MGGTVSATAGRGDKYLKRLGCEDNRWCNRNNHRTAKKRTPRQPEPDGDCVNQRPIIQKISRQISRSEKSPRYKFSNGNGKRIGVKVTVRIAEKE